MNDPSDYEPHWAEELRFEDTSVLLWLIKEAELIGAMWCEWGRLSISCMCICPVNLCFHHSSPHRLPPVFYVLSFSKVDEGHTSFIQIFPFVCALLTFDILLDLLAEWPRGFSFCKRKIKTAPVSEIKHIQKRKTNSVWCILHNDSWPMTICITLLFVMDGAVQCRVDIIHIWPFETEQT